MATAAVAPDLLAVIAFSQYLDARRTQKALSSKGGGSEWSLTQAFFLHMGGLMYRSPDPDGLTTTSILTKDMVAELLGTSDGSRPGAIVGFEDLPSNATIQDKSKTDGLAKSLAMLQCV